METATIDPAITEAESRVIAQKTALWQEQRWADRHLLHSGVRPGPAFRPIFERILSLIPAGSKVLDVGCGHGRLSIPLAEAGHDVVATDVSRQMLDILRKHQGGLPIEIRQGDAHRLAAADGEFDVVLSYDFMPHFPDWPRLLGEKTRACRDGGLIIFGFNFSEHHAFGRAFQCRPYEHPYSADPRGDRPFWAECSIDDMIKQGRELGLTVVQALPIRFLMDSFMFGQALGTEEYRVFQSEMSRRLEADPAAADFYAWLDTQLFQRLPFFAAYSSLVVFRRGDAITAPARPRPTVIDPASRDAFLSQIPSETSLAERQFLFNWFRNEWDGTGSVVEIGPFLGGTTRAIAWGMAQNPRRQPDARLHTLDRFGAYYAPEQLRTTVEPLVASGVFSPPQADALCRTRDFLPIFEALHRPQDYCRLVKVHNSPLPEFPDEAESSTALAPLDGASDLAALFIDGCKSWASTWYAMRHLLPRTRVGAPVIFQDYGWYTCFWISSFVHAAGDLLAFDRAVDSTYVYRLMRPVTADEIAQRFAVRPDAMGEGFFKQACLAGMKAAVARKDVRGGLVAQLHYVAALATIGRKADAARVLAKLDPKGFGPHGYMIEGSRRSPTYGPGNQPIPWTEN